MKKSFITISFLIMFMVGTDTFVISPLLPVLQHEYMVSNEKIGWLVSAYALGYAVFALIAGPISDGMDRKKLMITGLFLFSVSTILCGISSSFWTMLLYRLLAGIGAAILSPQVWAAIATLSPPDKIVKYMGIATMGLGVSQAVGVPIGSFLAAGSWSIPFFAIGILSLFLSLLTYLSMPNLPPRNSQSVNLIASYTRLFNIPKAKISFLAYFIFQMGGFSAFTFLGKWLADSYHGFLLPIAISFLQTISPKDRGTIASMTNSVMYFATMLGSVVAGVIYASFNGFLFVALFTALCFFISLTIFRRRLAEQPA
jgi:multidrug resistance protein